MSEERKGAEKEQKPREQGGREKAPKLGEGLARDMLSRGADELAAGLSLHGHEQGMHGHVYGRGR